LFLQLFQHGKCGVFPSNFVELLRSSVAPSTTSLTTATIPDMAKEETVSMTSVADKNKKNEKFKGLFKA
jgi:hypothetical protein